ncbi:MAG: hypothetical protein ACTHMS_12340 [Jatrophihabitans sp.]|uniref:hypothetical protein n=1 Tax=Jatrophihabitans sp. TaxID=1932789 RepID=UPI003F7DF5C1
MTGIGERGRPTTSGDLLALLNGAPPDALPWLGIAYAAGLADGRTSVYADLEAAGRSGAATAARTVWRQRPWDEIRATHEVDHKPCQRRCGSCSRCVHAAAWKARGGRPYLPAGAVLGADHA